jgi:formyl-CoA transferase
MGAAGIPVGKVNDVGAALALAEELGLGPTVDVGSGHPAQLRHPVRYSGFEPAPPSAPPALDADRAAVLAWLGI